MEDLPILLFETKADWERWLEANHRVDQAIWLKIAKKNSGKKSITYDEALRMALCFGWIDGLKNKFDDAYWLQRFTPRRPKSVWSQRNVDIVTQLIEQGKMREAGLQQVKQAKADGRWDAAYSAQSRAVVPDDLQQELDHHPAAKAYFEQLTATNRYTMIYRITTARKPETRRKRLEKYMAMLKAGEKIHH